MKIKCQDKFGKEYEFEESEYTYRKSVYGLAKQEDSILMVLDPRSDRWELPGGGVEAGESDKEALKREFIEESGLELTDSEPILIDESLGYFFALGEQKPWQTHRFYYQVTLSGKGKLLDNGNGDDTSAAKFMKISEIKELAVAMKDLSIIQKTSL